MEQSGVHDFLLMAGVGGKVFDEVASALPANRFVLIDCLGEQPNFKYANFDNH